MMISDTTSILSVIVLAVGMLILLLLIASRRPGWALNVTLVSSIITLITAIAILDSASPYDWASTSIGLTSLTAPVVWLLSIIILLNFKSLPQIQDNMPWWKIVARTIFFIIFGLLLLAGLLVVFNILGLIFFVFLILAAFRYQAAARCNRALEIVSTLAAAMRQNLPLPTSLETAAIGRKDKTARLFRRIAYWLTRGYSLAESIRKGYPRCLPQLLSAVESAEKIDQLPQTLLSLEKDLVNDSDETRKVRPVHPWYPVLVLIVTAFMGTGLLIFILPTFASLMSDMSDGHSGLSALTQFLINLSDAMMSWTSLLIIAGIAIAAAGWWLYYQFRTRISYKPGPFLNLVDRIRWFGPIQSKLERNLSTLRLIEILRPALTAGLPLPGAIAATLGAKINICFKNRVSRWLQCVENGKDAAQSARDCGIGHSIAWALDDKINPGQAPILLEMLEENCRSKHNYLGNIIRSIMWPIVIVAMGAFVGFIVYAMFIPMVQIITIAIQNVNP
jgi:type II secretory pathway component PulF